MAFDKNHASLSQKIFVIVFSVILVMSLCLPFFSGCSNATTAGTSGVDSDAATASNLTVAEVQEQYQTLLGSLEEKLAGDPGNLTTVASLGNNYMDYAMALDAASDADANEATVAEAFQTAIGYYDLYLLGVPADDANVSPVTVDRAICQFYAGEEEEAIAALTAFLETTPDYAMGWVNLGAFHEQRESYDEAIAAYDTAAGLDPEDELGVNSYASLRSLIVQSERDTAAAEAEAASDAAEGADGAAEPAADADEPAEGDDAAAEPAEGDQPADDADGPAAE